MTSENGRVAVVTGGTRGIGASITRTLIERGFRVAAGYHHDDGHAQDFAKETGASVYQFDVSEYDQCQEQCQAITNDMGPVSVLVNNAGIVRDGAFHKMDKENWDSVIQTNLGSVFNMCHALVGGMRDAKYGRIINISSINGQKGQFGQVNYSAAKAGIIGFTKALALESAGKGVTVNAICPGYIATEMTKQMRPEILEGVIKQIPAGRLGEPEEIASMVAYLASDEAAFINGATMTVNGGQYMA